MALVRYSLQLTQTLGWVLALDPVIDFPVEGFLMKPFVQPPQVALLVQLVQPSGQVLHFIVFSSPYWFPGHFFRQVELPDMKNRPVVLHVLH